MRPELQKKVEFGIKLIQAGAKKAAEIGQPIEIAYSGGKDSDCILELAKMAGVNYRAIYKNTTIDPPGTIKHAKENGVEIRQPKKNFLQLLKDGGCPSRHYRFCCHYLKEYHIMDYVVIGVRKSESTKRAMRYKEPEVCRVFNKRTKERQYLPLLEWSDQDVSDFIAERGIKCHPLYYDENGNFHVERRLGCMGCPLQSTKKRLEEMKKHPKIVLLYIRGMKHFFNSKPNSKIHNYYNDVYEWLFSELFCGSDYRLLTQKLKPDLWGGRLDCKKYLEQYFGIEL